MFEQQALLSGVPADGVREFPPMHMPDLVFCQGKKWMDPGLFSRIEKHGRADSADKPGDREPGAFVFSFTRAERKILRKRRKISVSEWAEKYRVVTMSAVAGPWQNEITPYLAGVMDAMGFSSVRVVTLCKPPQSGGTEVVHNFVGSVIDQDPGPVMYTFPDQNMAEENSRDRILPMIKSSPRLRGYLTGTKSDESMLRISLSHMPVYLSWASSPARLANKPIKVAIADETDKVMLRTGKEAGWMDLLDKRLNTFRAVSKFIKISTPTVETGVIWVSLLAAEVVFFYWVACPYCGRHQIMEFSRIKFGECRDPNEMRNKELAWYECPYCGAAWDDYDKKRAVGMGQWRAMCREAALTRAGKMIYKGKFPLDPPLQNGDEKDRAGINPAPTENGGNLPPVGLELGTYLETYRPKNIAFHWPAWISPFVSLSECAAAFLETLSGPNQDKTALERKEKLQNFCNQIEALPYQMVVMAPEAARFMAARCDLPAQSVPAEALALTCGVDVQKYGFYFVVRAWARDFTSWLIHYGMAGTWEDIEQILFAAEYPVVKSSPAPLCEREEENNSGRAGINPAPTDGAAKTLRIWRAAVDTGGGDREFTDQTMTEETYFWLRKNAVGRGCRIWGTKGASWDQAHKVKLSKMMDKTPSGKPLPGGLQILTLDTEKFKDAFFWRLDQALIHGEMAAYLHRDTGPDYFSHITAEQKEADAKGVLRWVKKRARNDWLDCECLAAACADPEWPGGGVNLIAPAAARKIHPPEKREDEVAAGRRRPGWFHRR